MTCLRWAPAPQATLGAQAGKPPPDAVLRTAMARTRPDGAAALWELELGGVADAPVDIEGMAARVRSGAMNGRARTVAWPR